MVCPFSEPNPVFVFLNPTIPFLLNRPRAGRGARRGAASNGGEAGDPPTQCSAALPCLSPGNVLCVCGVCVCVSVCVYVSVRLNVVVSDCRCLCVGMLSFCTCYSHKVTKLLHFKHFHLFCTNNDPKSCFYFLPF